MVGYQFELRVATEFEAGRLVYKSPIARQRASKTAASAFASRRFVVKENLPGTTGYYVVPIMRFYAPGSRTNVEGKGVLIYDRYLPKAGSQTFGSNACTFDFGQVFGGGD